MYIRLGPIPKDIGYPIGRKEKAQAAEVTLFEGNRHCFGKVSKNSGTVISNWNCR